MNQANILPYVFVRFSGVDAERFLQGQLSCDVSTLEDLSATFGTANTAKGRMYLLFVLIRDGEDYLMRIHQSVATQGLANLKKYMVFFKCEMHIEEGLKAHPVVSFAANTGAKPASYQSVVKTDSGYVWRCPGTNERYEAWSSRQPEQAAETSLEEWFAADCQAGVPELYPETLEQFILQQLNLQELQAVSFKKGCYTGQEIIARMKFLGKLKKKTFLITADDTTRLSPGAALFNAEGKKSGEVVRWHSLEHSGIGLAVLDIAAQSSQTLFSDPENTVKICSEEIKYSGE